MGSWACSCRLRHLREIVLYLCFCSDTELEKQGGGSRRVCAQYRSNLEQDSRRRVCCSTEGAGLMLGVAQREVLRSHWSNSCSSSSSVGPPTSERKNQIETPNLQRSEVITHE